MDVITIVAVTLLAVRIAGIAVSGVGYVRGRRRRP